MYLQWIFFSNSFNGQRTDKRRFRAKASSLTITTFSSTTWNSGATLQFLPLDLQDQEILNFLWKIYLLYPNLLYHPEQFLAIPYPWVSSASPVSGLFQGKFCRWGWFRQFLGMFSEQILAFLAWYLNKFPINFKYLDIYLRSFYK